MPAAQRLSSLHRRRVLVTGAASGIGLAVARELAARGAVLLLCDLPGEALTRAAAEIPNACALPADLSRREQVFELAREAGEVDVLVNSAGIQRVAPVERFDPAAWDLIQAVMLTAPFLLIRALVSGMYERSWGRIINVSSVHGLIASPYKSAYVAAKHGLMGLTKTVALEAGGRATNVTVNAVCPSYVRTPLVDRQIADQARLANITEEAVLEQVLLVRNAVKRLIEPEDVAAAVAFLCSEEAWSITGAAFTMDGGWLAH
ncbi:3-hydroxybutyrate dehydrogenase [Pendulispora albinea]|uniref:3-hydroxybutyrate dehydrogenase n=1 Tax=Pendulispora albinea TaxID=2741071 RepID=A0ABZ2MCU7_9BACT